MSIFSFETDIPMASQNQFAWMQSGELHMTMGKSSNATSVPLDTRYVSLFITNFKFTHLYSLFYWYAIAETTKRPIKMKLRLCRLIVPVQVPAIHNRFCFVSIKYSLRKHIFICMSHSSNLNLFVLDAFYLVCF